MTDITNIKQYMEWRAQREGQKVDVSPEAWALDRATNELFFVARNAIIEANPDGKGDDLNLPELVIAVNDVADAKEALNASN